jgi:hypothetical protein
MVENYGFVPSNQLGFRERHSTITHRTVKQAILFCSILDISQACDKVMACWTPVQIKTVSPSEPYRFTQIIAAQQTLL